MSSEEVTKLKTQIVAAYDRAPAKYKLQEGEGHVLTLGLSPRDLSKLCVATAPLQHLAHNCHFSSSICSRVISFRPSRSETERDETYIGTYVTVITLKQ